MATVGIRSLPAADYPGSGPLTQQNYHVRHTELFSSSSSSSSSNPSSTARQSPSLSQLRLSGGRSVLERGKEQRPCPGSRERVLGGEDQELMSQRPHASSDIQSGDPPQNNPDPVATTSAPTTASVSSASASASATDTTATTLSHPSASPQHGQQTAHAAAAQTQVPSATSIRDPEQSALIGSELTPPGSTGWQRPDYAEKGPLSVPPRSIGMQAILNPSSHPPLETVKRHRSRESLDSPVSASPSSSTPLQTTPSPVVPSTHSDQSRYQLDRPPWSPRIQQRRILTPRSPAVRAASLGSRLNPVVPGTITSPFVQSPQQSVSLHAEPQTRPNLEPLLTTSPATARYSFGPGTKGLTPGPYEQRPGLLRSRSQDTSPSTPQSSYSQFSQPSPGLGPTLMQQPVPTPSQQAPGVGNEQGRPGYPFESEASYQVEGGFLGGTPQMAAAVATSEGKIPVTIDRDSGSKKAAERRRKNSCASKRFRQRKKAGELEQMQAMKKQADEIKFLMEERDFYRVERDFYRDLHGRTVGVGALPARPLSPRLRQQTPQLGLMDREQQQQHSHPHPQRHHQQPQLQLQPIPRQWHEPPQGHEQMGRNVRQRTGSGPARLSYPPHSLTTTPTSTTPVHGAVAGYEPLSPYDPRAAYLPVPGPGPGQPPAQHQQPHPAQLPLPDTRPTSTTRSTYPPLPTTIPTTVPPPPPLTTNTQSQQSRDHLDRSWPPPGP